MTEEQRQRKNARQRERYRLESAEERQRREDRRRARRQRPEVRAQERAFAARRRAGLPPEKKQRAVDLNREWHRRRTPEQRAKMAAYLRRYGLKRAYGITPEQWRELFVAQGERCACCGVGEPGSKLGWSTDHCHETGRLRGILCRRCNTVLGCLGDSEERVNTECARFVEYLKSAKPRWNSEGRLVRWEP